MTYHVGVMTNEVVAQMNIRPGGLYVDATGGGGGHSRALLESDPTIRLIIFDVDPDACQGPLAELEQDYPDRVQVVWANYATISKSLKKLGVHQVDGIMSDLGTSWHQIHDKPGFSFATNTPLDMRMSAAHTPITAAILLNQASERELTYILSSYGEVDKAHKLAQLIVKTREEQPYQTTGQLVKTVTSLVPVRPHRIHPATLVFQALRIAVNKELEGLEHFTRQVPLILKPGARWVCISFHSLEDRIVKQVMKSDERMKALNKQVILPTELEVDQNHASRSAKMRVYERLS